MAARRSEATPKETRLDDHIDAPSTVAPGDAPADTTDPAERASTVEPDKAAAARAGHDTVNAVVKIGEDAPERDGSKDRIEKYKATRPDGTEVTVTHNVDTGETSVS